MDTAEVIFKQQLKSKIDSEPENYLSFGNNPSRYSYGHYGNDRVVARRASLYRTDLKKVDDTKVKSKFCVVM